ncbi:MAG: phosphatase PAP2 family protein [Clostridia bacterium]|nr:phosphatase PAP2 family protein [Clostridia bacterium]MBR5743084.1 phosphatase PAP2 family protein [Clostridia bacterium]
MGLSGVTFFFPWEVVLIEWLQANVGMVGAAIASFLSTFGEEIISVSVLGFLYWGLDKKFGRYVGLNMLLGIVWNPMIKNVFLRRRPYFDNANIACLKPVDSKADIYDIARQGYSFPSGHSTNSTTLFGSLARYRKSKWLTVLAFVIPFLCGVSRFILGVHYPTDVLAGWALGVVVIFLVPFLQEKIRNRWIFYGVVLVLTLPGFFYCKSSDYFTAFGLLIGFIAASEFEEKFVRFASTRHPLSIALRMLVGLGIYFLLLSVLKLPFPTEFLDSGTFWAYLVRTLRYAAATFLTMGVYPLLFRYFDRLFVKKTA